MSLKKKKKMLTKRKQVLDINWLKFFLKEIIGKCTIEIEQLSYIKLQIISSTNETNY